MKVAIESIFSKTENLERILENLKEGIIAHDLKRRSFYFNREAEKITGYRREEVLGKDCHQVFENPFCGDQCAFIFKTPSLMDQNEYSTRMMAKNGDIRHLDVSVTRMNDKQGHIMGVLASFRDITDLLALKMKTGQLKQFANMVGNDSKMLQVYQQIRDVADYDYPVNILGETGTGKELVAAAIHNESNRRHAPFVPINCGAMPEGLIESELFGHVKGAFSGALRDKRGRFELADGGTLFLDEVSDLSMPMQVKLLRFLQENTFEKVGGEKTIAVNVRIISATNRDLKQAVSKNRFRKDLFYRLNVIPFHLPPLRERKNDIPLLINHFLEEAAKTYGQEQLRVSREALSLMMDYLWPGNVRELQNTIQFAIVKCSRKEIGTNDLPLELVELKTAKSRRGAGRKLDLESVRMALKQTGGNKAKASRQLGVGRATLYRFLNDHPEAPQ